MTLRTAGIAREILIEVFESLKVFNVKSSLALVGIIIGTSAVISTFHVGHNAKIESLRQFETLGTDMIMMQPQAHDGRDAPVVSVEDILALPMQRIGLSAAAAIIQTGGNVRVGRRNIQATVIAATQDVYSLGNAKMKYGRETSDLDGYAPFAVVGSDIATEIQVATGEAAKIGARITVNNQILTLIGVLTETPANFILNVDFNTSVIIPFDAARRLVDRPTITNVAARLSSGADDVTTANAIRHYFDNRMDGGIMHVTTARAMISSIGEQMRIYATLLLGIGAVSLVVGGVGIMNVMLMSVMERRHEIGLRLAIGARRKDILLMFLCESLTLAIVGGVIGTCIGYFAGMIFAAGAGWEFQPAPLAPFLAAGMALIVGLFFGVYPALRAARLDPVVALRTAS